MIRSQFGVCIALFAALGTSTMSSAATPDPANSNHLALAAEYSAARLGISLLVMIDGEIIFEQYDNGGFAEWPHELASGTKSFSGVAAAIAADEGLLDFDEKLVDTLPEWKGDDRKEQITLRQLISLTSGLQTKVGSPPLYADAIKKPAVHEPGDQFDYGSTAYQVFGEVMRRKLEPKGIGVEEYYQEKIFKPLGIEVPRWRNGRDGNPHLPSGSSLTARQWATFGQFIVQQGEWNGKQIVSSDNLAECFKGSEANPGYGLTFWLARPVPAELVGRERVVRRGTDLYRSKFEGPEDLVLAAGAGNQRLYICPSLKLVVARQAVGIRQALMGRDIDFSDVELLARLLYGVGADGEPAATGNDLEKIDASDEERFLTRMRNRADTDNDGELDDAEVEALNSNLRRLYKLFAPR